MKGLNEMKSKRCKCGCGIKIDGHPNKKFFNKKHKDKFHNKTNPRGYYKHLNERNRDIEDISHPFDSYSLGQE